MYDITKKLIEELINKWIKANWLNDLSHPQVYIMAKGIEDIINQAQQPLIVVRSATVQWKC